MLDIDQLAQVVEELIAVMHLQAKELEKLVERIEQVTTRLDHGKQLSVIASELSALQQRIKDLRSIG
jgi:hypothetical protein